MIEIYEVIVDKNVKSVDDINEADFSVLNLLNEASIPYDKTLQEKVIDDFGALYTELFLVISVEEQYVEKVKELIGEELCMQSAISESIQNIGGESINASNAEKSKELDDFYEEDIIEDDSEQLDVEECQNIFYSLKDKYIKMTETRKKLICAYAIVGIFLTVIIMGYMFFHALQETQTPLITKEFIAFMVIAFSIIGVIGILGGINASIITKYNKIAKEKIVKPIVNTFLPGCKFSNQGISQKYYEKTEELPFKCSKFESENKIVGEIDSKKIIISEVTLIPRDKYVFPYSCCFVKSKLEKWHSKETCVNIFFNDDIEAFDLEILQDDIIIKKDKVNFDFVEDILALGQKYMLDFSLRYTGDVVILKLDYFNVFPDYKEIFENDFSKDVILKNVNIIKEILNIANWF